MTRSKKRTGTNAHGPSEPLKPYVAPAQTQTLADPRVFWTHAAMLAAELANEAPERSEDPLEWIAALEMAQEAVLAMGGERLVVDWGKAQRGRAQLAEQGITFHLDQDGPEDGSA